jgi:hypothetical protein
MATLRNLLLQSSNSGQYLSSQWESIVMFITVFRQSRTAA